ncbi:MAG: hypothetical protein ACREYE_23780 [Gammaproteobacteria bacterium]
MNYTIRLWLLVFALGLACPVQAGVHLGFYYGHHGHFGHHRYYRHRYDCYPCWPCYSHYYPDWSYRYYAHYPYHDGLVYGLLSIPRAVTGALFGSSHRYSYKDSSRADYRSNERPATTGEGSGRNSTAKRMDLSREWDLVASRRYGEALRGFEAVAQKNPGWGEPEIGYALASASLGNLSRGVWAMRRAYRLDREVVGSIKIDARVRPQIERLLLQYQNNARVDRLEAAFMRASLYFLLGDMGRAELELKIALEEGDRSLSTLHLRGLIAKASGGGTAG